MPANLAEIVPAAVGIALNPPAVVAVILLLSSSHPRRGALAFLIGWLTGLLAVGGIVLLAGDLGGLLGGPSVLTLALKLTVGLALMVGAFLQWRAGSAGRGGKEVPGWMRSIEGLSAGRAFVTAALFAALNPKSLALNIAGTVSIVESTERVFAQVGLLVLFVSLASATVAAPVVAFLAAEDHARRSLDASRDWLVDNSAAITATVLAVLGVVVTSGAVEGFAAL